MLRALDRHDRLFSEQEEEAGEEEINMETASNDNTQARTFVSPAGPTYLSSKMSEGARARSRSVPRARSDNHAKASGTSQPSPSTSQTIQASTSKASTSQASTSQPSTSQASTTQTTFKDGIPTDPKVLGIRLFVNEPKKFHNNSRKSIGDEINKGIIKYTFSNLEFRSPEKETQILKHLHQGNINIMPSMIEKRNPSKIRNGFEEARQACPDSKKERM